MLKCKVVVDDSMSDGDKDSSTENVSGLHLKNLTINGPRKKLLVLDLNGFLVHRIYRYGPNPTKLQDYGTPDAISGNFLVFSRPFCNEFLEFCFERFEVGVWSSARERNMDTIFNTIKNGLKDKLLFIWDQEKCTDSGFKSLKKKDKPIFLKELRKLWEDIGKFSSSNTLLIDDEPYKALLNPPNTAIFPHSFKVDNGNDSFLGPKSELRIFLDGLADADDVPSYVKEHQIGQLAITESHTNWDFYSKIVRSFAKRS